MLGERTLRRPSTEETIPMPNIQVTFNRIEVSQDGDPGITDGAGELYWTFNVNGTKVSERTSSNYRSARDGDVIDLDTSKSVELHSDQELVVSGFLAEKDQLGTGKDENAPFTRTFDRSENWGDGARQVRLQDKKLDCTLYYTIQAE